MNNSGRKFIALVERQRALLGFLLVAFFSLVMLGCPAVTGNETGGGGIDLNPGDVKIRSSKNLGKKTIYEESTILLYAESKDNASYQWQLALGSELPRGLTLTNHSNLVAKISGTPTVLGDFEFTLFIINEATLEIPAIETFTLEIIHPSLQGTGTLTVTSPGFLFGNIRVPFSKKFMTVTGGRAPYHWELIGAPDWISIDPDTGELTGLAPLGTPEDIYTFTVYVEDSKGSPEFGALEVDFSLLELMALTIITPDVLVAATENQDYSLTLEAVKFYHTGAYTGYGFFFANGTLPDGITLVPGYTTLSGKPTIGSAGDYTFTLLVLDIGGYTDTKTFSLKVFPGTPDPLTTDVPSALPFAVEGSPYLSVQANAQGGVPPYTWSLGSGAPSWLSISANGKLSGRPGITDIGSTSFTLSVTDSWSPTPTTVPTPVTLRVFGKDELHFYAYSLPKGYVGAQYSYTLQAVGGTAPYSWTLVSAPQWLSLEANGVLSGRPVSADQGTGTVKLRLSDSAGGSIEQEFAIEVAAPNEVLVTGSTAVSLHLFEDFTSPLYTASLGVDYYEWTLEGDVPSWLRVKTNGTSGGGTLIGTQQTALLVEPVYEILEESIFASIGTHRMTIVATDRIGKRGALDIELTILPEGGPITLHQVGATPKAYVGEIYGAGIIPRGGNNIYTSIAITSGKPAWLSLKAEITPETGRLDMAALYGVPTETGIHTVVIEAIDSDGLTGQKSITITVEAAPAPGTIIPLVAPLAAKFNEVIPATYLGAGMPLGLNRVWKAAGIDFDPSGRYMFVADIEPGAMPRPSSVRRIDLSTGLTEMWFIDKDFGQVEDLRVHTDGSMYIATFDKGVSKIRDAMALPIAASDVTSLNVAVAWPLEIEVDDAGRYAYICDWYPTLATGSTVTKVDLQSNTVAGQTGVPGDSVQGVVTRGNDVFIAHGFNSDPITFVDYKTAIVSHIGTFPASSPVTVNSDVYYAGSIDFDSQGNLFITENYYGEVWKIKKDAQGNISSQSEVVKYGPIPVEYHEVDLRVDAEDNVYVSCRSPDSEYSGHIWKIIKP